MRKSAKKCVLVWAGLQEKKKNNEMSCRNVQAPELERPLSEMQMIDTAALNFLNHNKIRSL